MTQEEKQLLFKDLCARLPYGIKCQIDYDNEEDADLGIERYCDDRIVSVCIETEEIGLYEASEYFYPDEIKPYLRPMSNMTEEEIKEFTGFTSISQHRFFKGDSYFWYNTYEEEDWLNAHHFDYRGLIEKGLALEAPEEMYKK